jgi:hypothetical protein
MGQQAQEHSIATTAGVSSAHMGKRKVAEDPDTQGLHQD